MEFGRHLATTQVRAPATGSSAVRHLLVARSLREFGDGFVVLLLPVYLTALGLSPFEVGAVASAALFGSTLLAGALTLLATRYDYRQLLIGAAGLMIATGVALSLFDDYAVLFVVAFAGSVNPSTGSFSPAAPLEHAVLAREASNARRTRMFVSYSLIGALAGALGALAACTPDFLIRAGLGQLAALKAMFVLYALLGLFGGLIYSRIPARRRLPKEHTACTLRASRFDVYKLTALFCLDAFAGGLVVQSLLALWLFLRFDMSLTAAALFFAWSGILSAFSFPLTASLSRRIGLINTMVFTHFTSSIFLILAAIAPTLSIALILLLLRATLSQIDAPIRSAYLTAILSEYERPAAEAITSVSSRIAASAGPALAGALLATSFRGWPLVIAGTLQIISGVLLLLEFRHVKPPEEARNVRGSAVPQNGSRPLPSDLSSLPRPTGNN